MLEANRPQSAHNPLSLYSGGHLVEIADLGFRKASHTSQLGEQQRGAIMVTTVVATVRKTECAEGVSP